MYVFILGKPQLCFFSKFSDDGLLFRFVFFHFSGGDSERIWLAFIILPKEKKYFVFPLCKNTYNFKLGGKMFWFFSVEHPNVEIWSKKVLHFDFLYFYSELVIFSLL
jgi:hypothetical protein